MNDATAATRFPNGAMHFAFGAIDFASGAVNYRNEVVRDASNTIDARKGVVFDNSAHSTHGSARRSRGVSDSSEGMRHAASDCC